MANNFNSSEIKLFTGVAKTKVDELLAQCDRKTFRPGQHLFKEGDTSNFLVIVVNGNLKVESNGYVLAHVVDQEVVGEMGVFTGQVRSADVVATAESQVIIISKKGLDVFLESNPKEARQIFTNVIKVLAQHLKNNNFIIELSQLEEQLE